MSATPHANGGLLTRDLDLPDFRDYAIDVPTPARAARRVDPQARRDDARHLPPQPRPVPAVLPRRDQQQPARCGVRGVRPGLHGARSPTTTSRSSADGRVMEVLSRAQLPRLAGGLHPDRAARHVRHLRGVRDGERLADDPAQQVAGGGRPPALAGQGAEPQRPADLDRVAQRPQRLLPPGAGPDPERASPSAATSARVYLPPDANCLLSVADHCLRSRSYVNLIVIDKQPQLQWLTHRRGDRALRPRRRGLGVGRHRRRQRRPRHRAGLRRRRRHDGDGRRRRRSCASGCPHFAVRVVNVVDLMTLPRPQDHPHGMDETLFTRAVHRPRRRGVRLPRLPGRDPPAGARPAGRRPVPGPRLHRGGHDDDAVRHGGAQPGVALPPGDGRASTTPGALRRGASELKAWCQAKLAEHEAYVVEHLEDMPEVRDWVARRLGREGLTRPPGQGASAPDGGSRASRRTVSWIWPT